MNILIVKPLAYQEVDYFHVINCHEKEIDEIINCWKLVHFGSFCDEDGDTDCAFINYLKAIDTKGYSMDKYHQFRSGYIYKRNENENDIKLEYLIKQCDRMVVYAKNVNSCTWTCMAWRHNIPCIIIEPPEIPFINDSSYRNISTKKEKHYEIEDKHGRYLRTDICKEYTFEEYEGLRHHKKDKFTLSVSGQDFIIAIYSLSYQWIEEVINREFPELMTDKYIDYELHYKRDSVDASIFSFRGYTKGYRINERIDLSSQFKILHNDKEMDSAYEISKFFGTPDRLKKYFDDEIFPPLTLD